MLKFIKSGISFSVIFFMIYPFVIFLMGNYLPSSFLFRINYLNENSQTFYSLSEVVNYKDVDILILGSSHSFVGFDSRIFNKNGYSTYNLGTSAQTPLQTQVLLKRHLEKLNPRLIIYEVYPPYILANDGVQSALDLLSHTINDKNSIEMAFMVNDIKVYNTLIYSLTRDVLPFNKLKKNFIINEPQKIGNDFYIPGGFLAKKISFFKFTIQPKEKLIYEDKQLKAFEENIKLIKRNNIKLILVFAPLPKSTYNSYINMDEIQCLFNKYENYYNFNEMLDLNDSLHFYDRDHINPIGVELFNAELIKIINLFLK